MQEFSPYRAYRNTLHHWWLLVLCILAGGVLGLVFHHLRPATYEAQTFLVASLNFPPNDYYSQYEEDYAFTAAATHVSPLSIASNLVPALQAQGYAVTVEDFLRQASLERMQSTWALRYRSTDPDLAAAVAEQWALQAYEKLAGLQKHAIQTQTYYNQLRSLNACYYDALASRTEQLVLPSDYQSVCVFSSAEKIHSQQVTVSRLFAEELRLSRGMNPYFVIGVPDTAETQIYQTAYDRNLMTLAGALIGFVVGLWLANIGELDKGKRG